MDGFVVTSRTSFAMPAATPRPIGDRPGSELRAIRADLALRQGAEGIGAKLLSSAPEEVRAQAAVEIPRWREVVGISGAHAE